MFYVFTHSDVSVNLIYTYTYGIVSSLREAVPCCKRIPHQPQPIEKKFISCNDSEHALDMFWMICLQSKYGRIAY